MALCTNKFVIMTYRYSWFVYKARPIILSKRTKKDAYAQCTDVLVFDYKLFAHLVVGIFKLGSHTWNHGVIYGADGDAHTAA